MVRAHAILHDDNAVVRRDTAGVLIFNFNHIDAIYDQLLGYGLRPVVELSFMPAALARDPQQTIFSYRGIISPPADWAEWRQLVGALASHLVQRYGTDEVAQWAFEVWNEPNLAVFWSGTMADYLRLYDESVRAIKAVSSRELVGEPRTLRRRMDRAAGRACRAIRRAAGLRLHAHLRQPAAGRAARAAQARP